jgi:hypothetical protein
MALLRVGEIAELTVVRDGKPMAIRATIAPGSDQRANQPRASDQRAKSK